MSVTVTVLSALSLVSSVLAIVYVMCYAPYVCVSMFIVYARLSNLSTSFFQIVYYAVKPLCFVCACFFSCHSIALPTTFFVFYVCIVFFCCYIIPPVACTFARFAVSNCVTVVRFPVSNVFFCFFS